MRYLLLFPGTPVTCTEVCMEMSREAEDYLPFTNESFWQVIVCVAFVFHLFTVQRPSAGIASAVWG